MIQELFFRFWNRRRDGETNDRSLLDADLIAAAEQKDGNGNERTLHNIFASTFTQDFDVVRLVVFLVTI